MVTFYWVDFYHDRYLHCCNSEAEQKTEKICHIFFYNYDSGIIIYFRIWNDKIN